MTAGVVDVESRSRRLGVELVVPGSTIASRVTLVGVDSSSKGGGPEVDAVVLIDDIGVVRCWSDGAVRLFGHPVEHAVGRELAELLVPPALAAAHRDGLARFARSDVWPPPTRTLTFPAVALDQRQIPVVVTLLPVDVDGSHWCAGVIRAASSDLVGRSLTALPEMDLLQTIFERAPEVITIIDPLGRQRSVNAAGSLLMGYGTEGHDSAGRELIHPDDSARVAERFERMMAGQQDPQEAIRFRVLAGDGRWVWLEMLTADLTDIEGFGGYVAFSRDVSEDEQRRADLEVARLDAEDASEQLGQLAASRLMFASAVSHELRTPLTSISSAVESLLAERPADNADLESYLALIGRNATRLSRIIDDLLFLGRHDAGAIDILHEPLDVVAVVEALVVDLQADAARRSLNLDLRASDGPLLRGDNERLGQALENVLRNAIKFADEATVIKIRCNASIDRWIVRVENAGPTVAVVDAERAFDAFVRLDGSRHTAGSGLGLTVARSIVEAHGGTIYFEQVKPGARVVIELPYG